ncbi:MAG: tetratricopeptide repeat protein, partial [Candidatus Eisenbacteria bacterium]|nr:tetratricopeptide repeat protein [Candidatus Eisenbacteria bacterium]
RISKQGRLSSSKISAKVWAKGVRGDLDWVVLKALEKDRARRYATASALAEDLDRHLNHEPVEAGPPSTRYRVKKFARRNRAALFAGAAVTFGLVSTVVAFGLSAVQANRERERTAIALQEAEAVTDFLTQTLAAAGPRQQGKDVTVVEMLEQAETSLPTTFADRPFVQARLQHTLAVTYGDLGEYPRSDSLFAEAVANLESLVGENDPKTLEAKNNWAATLVQLGLPARSESLLVIVYDKRTEVLGEKHPETLASKLGLATAVAAQSRPEEALQLLVEAREGLLEVASENSKEAWMCLSGMAEIHSRQGKAEAESLLTLAYETGEPIFGASHPRILVAGNNLATHFFRTGRYAEALPIAEHVLRVRRETLGNRHSDTMVSINLVAGCLLRLDRVDESVPFFEEVLATTREVQGNSHPRAIVFGNNVASLYRRQARFEEAKTLYKEILELGEPVLGESHQTLVLARGSLGDCYNQLGQTEQALKELSMALDRGRTGLPEGHWVIGETLRKRGVCLTASKDWRGAEAALLEAHVILKDAHGDSHPRVQSCIDNLVDLYGLTGETAKAQALRPDVTGS